MIYEYTLYMQLHFSRLARYTIEIYILYLVIYDVFKKLML